MSVATLTSKGQVTIPKPVRDRLHLRTGDKLDFRVEDDGTIRVYPIARRVADVFGLLADRARGAYATDEIDAALGDALRKNKQGKA